MPSTIALDAGPSNYDPISAHSSRYECQYCGKGFTRPSSLKARLSLSSLSKGNRTDERASERRYTFIATPENAVSDTRSHAGLDLCEFAAFKCTFEGCERTFSVLSNMRRHARTHQHPNAADVQETSEDDQDDGEDSPTAPQGSGGSGSGRRGRGSSSGGRSN